MLKPNECLRFLSVCSEMHVELLLIESLRLPLAQPCAGHRMLTPLRTQEPLIQAAGPGPSCLLCVPEVTESSDGKCVHVFLWSWCSGVPVQAGL